MPAPGATAGLANIQEEQQPQHHLHHLTHHFQHHPQQQQYQNQFHDVDTHLQPSSAWESAGFADDQEDFCEEDEDSLLNLADGFSDMPVRTDLSLRSECPSLKHGNWEYEGN
ncbi:hypothetical protein KP509_1Z189100 [Ceratopteris richardii]|nr:hypothetical protein KP509_1Z189100 [Ceratopteris richardii]